MKSALIAAAVLSGCVSVPAHNLKAQESPAEAKEVTFKIREARDVDYGTPGIAVDVVNGSSVTLCLSKMVFGFDFPRAMRVALRPSPGQELVKVEPGYPVPSLPGTERLAPGQSAHGRYFFKGIYNLPKNGFAGPPRWSARLSFQAQDCKTGKQLLADSGWQTIGEPGVAAR